MPVFPSIPSMAMLASFQEKPLPNFRPTDRFGKRNTYSICNKYFAILPPNWLLWRVFV